MLTTTKNFFSVVMKYDLDQETITAPISTKQSRITEVLIIVLPMLFALTSIFFIFTDQVDNKITEASSGLYRAHREVTLDLANWFTDGIWWKGRQTPKPLPRTVYGLVFYGAGYDPRFIMTVNALLGALGGYLIAQISWRRFGVIAGLLTLILYLLCPLVLHISLSGFTFIWAVTFLLLSIYLLDQYQLKRKYMFYLLAAAALLCAGMSRPEMYGVAFIVLIFVSAPLKYRLFFLGIAFLYPILQQVVQLFFLGGVSSGFQLRADARSEMGFTTLFTQWTTDMVRILKYSFSIPTLLVGAFGWLLFSATHRRFLASIFLYFGLVFFALFAMRRLSFNHPGYYLSLTVLFIPFIAFGMIWLTERFYDLLETISQSKRRNLVIVLLLTTLFLYVNLQDIEQPNNAWLSFRMHKDIRDIPNYVNDHMDSTSSIILDYFVETSWLLGELESTPGRAIWFYNTNSTPRPPVNAAEKNISKEVVQAMNEWTKSGFIQWANEYRPEYFIMPTAQEWNSKKKVSHYLVYSLQPSLEGYLRNQSQPPEIPLNDETSMYLELLYTNQRAEIYKITYDDPSPRLLANRYYEQATELYDASQYTRAISSYENAIRLSPDNYAYYIGLGDSFRANKQLEEAVDAYQKAIVINPNLERPYRLLGHIYLSQNKLAQAIESYQMAIALNPDIHSTHFGLGQAYDAKGMIEEARQEFRIVVNLTANLDDDGKSHRLNNLAHEYLDKYQ